MKLNDNFMMHFRWITPLFLFLLNIIIMMALFIAKGYLGQVEEIRIDLGKVHNDISDAKVDIAYIKGRLK